MNQIIQSISRLFSKFTAWGASLSMIGLFSIIFINSIRRYTIGKSLEFGEELPVFIAIYGVIFGTAWAYMLDRHIRFTMLVGFLSEQWTRRLYLLVDLIMVANGCLMAWSGWMFVIKRGGMEASGIITLARDLKNATGWENMIWIGHMYPYQAAMMAGGVLLTLAAGLKFFLRVSQGTQIQADGV
jgi:TRAP-type C4-dicarboxylate transport system permease small subunit